jgi:hypothetical protein
VYRHVCGSAVMGWVIFPGATRVCKADVLINGLWRLMQARLRGILSPHTGSHGAAQEGTAAWVGHTVFRAIALVEFWSDYCGDA